MVSIHRKAYRNAASRSPGAAAPLLGQARRLLGPADGFFDRHLFAGSRDWICSRASGPVLEVAIGTGLNLAHYPASVQLTGMEWSPAMLQIARNRARQLDVDLDLRQGDAQALEFPGADFDTVVCTFSLCAIPDDRRAVEEMARVLQPGGLLLLAGHVEASPWYARAAQALIEWPTPPSACCCRGTWPPRPIGKPLESPRAVTLHSRNDRHGPPASRRAALTPARQRGAPP